MALADFGLSVDASLDVMRPNQTLASLSSSLFVEIEKSLDGDKFDWVIVQGDTTTVMIGALCAFYRKIKVAHVEAGLRSHDILAPFPEELNRKVAGMIATLHFAPTLAAAENLVHEGISNSRVYVTGNTGIDSLMLTSNSFENEIPPLEEEINNFTRRYQKYVLITGHRRENFGKGFQEICKAISTLAERHPHIGFLYPVHLNPNVRDTVYSILAGIDNILMIEPQNYRKFIYLMKNCYFILSDSGGVQEEAPSLGKPVLVMREVTERMESVHAGCSELVGSSYERIVERCEALLSDSALYDRMSLAQNPYGDGQAAARIVDAIKNYK